MTQITQEMINAVFSDPKLRKKFKRPQKAKEICELRLTGAYFKDIGTKVGCSPYFARDCVYKTVVYYQIHIQEKE